MEKKLSGTIVDIVSKEIFPGTLIFANGKITAIKKDETALSPHYILPGFIDAHIHIESSMLIPSEFARLASVHGTVATVSDPHEIANVLGIEGIRYMIENGKQVPFHFYFGASSCVPATQFETAGAKIDAEEINELFVTDKLKYLSEMMNFPGVLANDPEILKKINVAKKFNKPVDGHAPGLKGEKAQQYVAAGISTDHECVELQEALDKIQFGMHILIREGSAAKNYEALHTLLKTHPEKVMLCSDDKHPHELVEGHINLLVKRSLQHGYELMDVLRAASMHPVKHYGLDTGLLQTGDSADFIVVDNLQDLNILETYIKGQLVAKEGRSYIPRHEAATPNHFNCAKKEVSDFIATAAGDEIRVIEALDGQLITKEVLAQAKKADNNIISDVENDILKITVVNRYQDRPAAIAFIKNFGLKRGAIASCVAHDSHNIVAVGCSDEELCAAINVVIDNKGGIAAVDGEEKISLPLPVAGIMSKADGYEIAKQYTAIDSFAKTLGAQLEAPFMTLSFMALLVIPELKLSDKGLFSTSKFQFVPLQPSLS